MPSSQKRRLSPVEHAPPIQPAVADRCADLPVQSRSQEQKYQNQELRHQLRQQSPCVLSGRKRALPSEVPVSKACRIRTSNEGEAAIAAVPTEVQAATAGVGASCLTAAVSEEKPTMGSAPPPDAPSSCVALVPYGQNHIYEPLLRPLQQQQDLLMQQNLADPLAALSEIQEPQHFIRGLTAAEAVAKAGVLLIPASTRARAEAAHTVAKTAAAAGAALRLPFHERCHAAANELQRIPVVAIAATGAVGSCAFTAERTRVRVLIPLGRNLAATKDGEETQMAFFWVFCTSFSAPAWGDTAPVKASPCDGCCRFVRNNVSPKENTRRFGGWCGGEPPAVAAFWCLSAITSVNPICFDIRATRRGSGKRAVPHAPNCGVAAKSSDCESMHLSQYSTAVDKEDWQGPHSHKRGFVSRAWHERAKIVDVK
ncbi:uncharacterized protein LOC34620424 [Cyclospora cayetanensis]|uniref:Uncharacterized protein LOC34620424 n=1 Tax=Cyclospora cayetanensis TaxID=88456 RepID=A0A6P6RZM4_9EIME|nr:uncharacterized protein LOC34620424 [Cyclospora cayetanensis]